MAESLGYIDIPAAGTRVRLTTDTSLLAHAIFFQARAGNTGIIYIGSSTVASNGTGMFAALAVPTVNLYPAWAIGSASFPRVIQVSDFYVDTNVNGSDVLVAYH